MMEIKEAIEILERVKQYGGRLGFENLIELEALTIAIDTLSKIENAEMPQRRMRCVGTSDWNGTHWNVDLSKRINPTRVEKIMMDDLIDSGYNQCHDLWLPYHLKKMEERVDVEKIETIMSKMNCRRICSELDCRKVAQAIAKEINK
jgi:hypothetical protein